MRPNSDFLCDLNRDCATLERAGFVSIWTRFDLMIVPARSSLLPVGRSVHVGVLAQQQNRPEFDDAVWPEIAGQAPF